MEEDGSKRQRVMGHANDGRGGPHREDWTARSSPGVPEEPEYPLCCTLTPIRELEGDTERDIEHFVVPGKKKKVVEHLMIAICSG